MGRLKFSPEDPQERDYYIGRFKMDEMDGQGTMYMKNGDSYRTIFETGSMRNQGVYTFANGIQCRIVEKDNALEFEDRLIFPPDDYRLEYRGGIKNGCIMHGHGILIVKNVDGDENKL